MDSNSSSDLPGSSSGDVTTGEVTTGSRTRAVLAPKWLGKRVGRFKLLALLGQGAMGRVFRAEDTLMQRHVALKLLPRSVKRGQNSVRAEMLIREARAAAAIEHPNAVQIYEINEAGDVYYIAMELLEGGSLRDLVKAAGPLDPIRACLLAAEAAEALAYAHSVGVVHRDVKPANLMLNRAGRCKVVDFGLARVDDPSDLTRFLAESVGTPQFIAPEILTGTPASAQSDIYSLGGTVWYLLTGHPPFEAGTSQELLHKHVSCPLPDLRAIRPEVPAGLAEALATALAKSPGQRFASMEQFARVLRIHTIPIAGIMPRMEIGLPAPVASPPVARPASPGPARPVTPPERVAPQPARKAAEVPQKKRTAHVAPPLWRDWKVITGACIAGALALLIGCVILLRPKSPTVAQGTGSDPASVQAPAPAPDESQGNPPPASPVQSSAPPANLVAQWVADDYVSGGDWTDRIHKIVAQEKNSPGTAPGAFNGRQGVVLNGSNQFFLLSAGDYPPPDGNTMTVFAVFKPAGPGPQGKDFWSGAGLVGADIPGTVDDWTMAWGGPTGTQVLAGAGNFPPTQEGTIRSPDLEVDRPHVAAMVWQFNAGQPETATLSLYVDGIRVAQDTQPSHPRTREDAIALGAQGGGGYNPFNGMLAEVRIYSDANEDVGAISEELLKTYASSDERSSPLDPNGLFHR